MFIVAASVSRIRLLRVTAVQAHGTELIRRGVLSSAEQFAGGDFIRTAVIS